MPKFIKMNKRGAWTLPQMQAAVRDVVLFKKSEKHASRENRVPRQTLRRRLAKTRSGESLIKTLGRKPVLSSDLEEQLTNAILDMEGKLFGLTRNDVRRYVYIFCEKNKLKHRFDRAAGMAGKDWLRGFLKRHPQVSYRIPEPTSIQRAIGFNKAKVEKFMDLLEKTLLDENGKRLIPEGNIYNVDESGFTICHKPGKVFAKKGKRAVGTLTSSEKGKNVTVVACVSATGVYVPPMFIFPRVRMKPELLDGAPPGSVGHANKTGWMNEELFICWFEHFLTTIQPIHKSHPVLLILDGHSSHTKNLDLIEKARRNNVTILSLPSHCTHKLQPLDVAIFKSINSFYNKAIHTWLLQHPGRAVTEYHIASLFGGAYAKAATHRNAVSGFRKTGINPFNRHIFSEEDFSAAEVTDMPPVSVAEIPQPLTNAASATSDLPQPSTSTTHVQPDMMPTATTNLPIGETGVPHVSFEDIIVAPKITSFD